MIVIILLFLIFSFFGWLIDSTYCTLVFKKLTISGYYKNLPFCPIYGFGGLIITGMFLGLRDFSPILVILFTTLSVILLEFWGGWFCDKILKEKLWDYSDLKFNLGGYVSLLHSFYWLVLVSLVFFFASPYLANVEKNLKLAQESLSSYDFYFTSVFLVIAFLYTIHTRANRIKEYLIKCKEEIMGEEEK